MMLFSFCLTGALGNTIWVATNQEFSEEVRGRKKSHISDDENEDSYARADKVSLLQTCHFNLYCIVLYCI